MTAKEVFPELLRAIADAFERSEVDSRLLKRFDAYGVQIHVVFQPGQQVQLEVKARDEEASPLAISRWNER